MKRLVPTLLLAALVIAPTSRAASPDKPKPKPQPPKFHPGVVKDGHFISITREGHLVSSDLCWGTKRDYGDLGTKLGPHVAVRNDQACVACKDHVYVVALASGKILHKAKHDPGIVRVGFWGEGVYTVNQKVVEVFGLCDAKPQRTVALRPEKTTAAKGKPWRGFGGFPWDEKQGVPCCRSGKMLYVALPTQAKKDLPGEGHPTLSDVAVVDLEKGKLLDRVKLRTGIIDIHVIRGRYVDYEMVYVCRGSFSYGMLMKNFQAFPVKNGKIDVKSKQARYAGLPIDMPGKPSQSTFLGPYGYLYMAHGKTISEFASGGTQKVVAQGKSPTNGRIVGFWRRSVLLSDAKGIRMVKLSPVDSAAQKSESKTR